MLGARLGNYFNYLLFSQILFKTVLIKHNDINNKKILMIWEQTQNASSPGDSVFFLTDYTSGYSSI